MRSRVSALQCNAYLLAQADRAVFPVSLNRSLVTDKAVRASLCTSAFWVQNVSVLALVM